MITDKGSVEIQDKELEKSAAIVLLLNPFPSH